MFDRWRYWSGGQTLDFLVELDLFQGYGWSPKRQIACLYGLSNHAGNHYHPAAIKRKDGSLRYLSVPDRLMKGVQRNILRHILADMEISPLATAYKKGSGVAVNGAAHLGQTQVVKLDIRHFFDAIDFSMVHRQVFSMRYFPQPVGVLLTSLCCLEGRLPQGAPTSPAISNLVMRPFDTHMGEWCRQRGINYTRYCDDMTFSGDMDPGQVIGKVSGFLEVMGLELNENKTAVLHRHRRQEVTGVVVNDKLQVQREYRRKIRQELYYCERFGVKAHLERIGERDLDTYLGRLLGKINFVLQVNPDDPEFQRARARWKALAG